VEENNYLDKKWETAFLLYFIWSIKRFLEGYRGFGTNIYRKQFELMEPENIT